MVYVMNKTTLTEPNTLVSYGESAVNLVNRFIQQAIDKQASDIHIEPREHDWRIRFRNDGLLHEVATIPSSLGTQIITRLKIMANLNIAEQRQPQDGHIPIQDRIQIDIRISTCPTLFGEKIVLRLLDSQAMSIDLDHLGLTDTQKELLINTLNQAQGLILVTGPTGSGKTTTLYSALHYLNQIEKNIVTLEDPVEIELKGINQININTKIGLDFATVLRALLRQDPDIMMIGEIRDYETATIAIQAAQTGHLVLSTLHTNNAIETLIRLQYMGIPTYHIISSISLMIAQRLVRKLCHYCKQIDLSGVHYNPVGCHHCYKGYKGRIGIFELIPMTKALAQVLLAGGDKLTVLKQIKQENRILLADAGQEKTDYGTTSLTEINRVLTK